MFFREPNGKWAFSALMKGLEGRSADSSRRHIERMLADLVYPANPHWDQTQEQQQRANNGDFGRAGIHGKATMDSLIKSGELPCVASRSDQANLMLGHMTPDALRQVNQNGHLPRNVRDTAQQMIDNSRLAQALQGTAQAVGQMEQAQTERQRQEIAKNMNKVTPTEPTIEESNVAQVDLSSLFDAI